MVQKRPNTQKGFTLLEIIIAIAVLAIIATFVARPLLGFRNEQVLTATAERIITTLNEARTNTVSSKGGFQYGVHFETNRVVLFQGASFTEPNTANKEFALHPQTDISTITLAGGGSDVLFQRLTGKTDQYGSVVLQLKNNAPSTREITIEQTGVVSISQ